MNLISARLPQLFVEIIDEMVLSGKYASRSECIRVAIRDFYKEHFEKAQESFIIPEVDDSSNIIFEDK